VSYYATISYIVPLFDEIAIGSFGISSRMDYLDFILVCLEEKQDEIEMIIELAARLFSRYEMCVIRN